MPLEAVLPDCFLIFILFSFKDCQCKDMNPAMWQHTTIEKIERVENGMQEDGSAEPYYKASFRRAARVVALPVL